MSTPSVAFRSAICDHCTPRTASASPDFSIATRVSGEATSMNSTVASLFG
jgi:hypothetical protein